MFWRYESWAWGGMCHGEGIRVLAEHGEGLQCPGGLEPGIASHSQVMLRGSSR